ncbi:MAG: hypothetical protein ACYTGB_20125, partial [Planctomycetota bacterium]
MNTFLWFFIELFNPVIMWFYPACDWILLWTTKLGGVWGVLAIGVLTGLGVNLFQKFCSNQDLLGRCKRDLDKLKKTIAEAKKSGDEDRQTRAMNVSGRISGKYMWGSLKPAFMTVPPVIIIAMWTGSRLGYKPVRPGQEIDITACFENEARGYAHIICGDGLKVVGAPVSPVVKYAESEAEKKRRKETQKQADADGPVKLWNPFSWFNTTPLPERGIEAHWTIKAERAGEHHFEVRYPTEEGFKTAVIDFPVCDGPGRPPEFFNFLVFDTPTMDHMQTVGFNEG